MNEERATPWYAVDNRVSCGAPGCRTWCICECQFAEDAREITRRVNAFDGLVAACEMVSKLVDDVTIRHDEEDCLAAYGMSKCTCGVADAVAAVNAALAAAKGET